MDDLERRIGAAYAGWKSRHAGSPGEHPGDEDFACFIDGQLAPEAEGKVRRHILSCPECGRRLKACLMRQFAAEEPPAGLLEKTRRLLEQRLESCLMDLVVRARGGSLQLESTTGDVLVGQEFIPAGVFRSRQAQDFRDGLTVFKDFKQLRIELRLEIREDGFAVAVGGKEKETQQAVPGLRMSLVKDDRELESYRSETGKVVFTGVRAGRYTITVSAGEETLAVLFLEIIA